MHIYEETLFEKILLGDEDAAIEAVEAISAFDPADNTTEEKSPSLDTLDANGSSALQHAVNLNLINVVETLLLSSADIKNSPKITLVDIAINRQNSPMLQLLLEHDAPIDNIIKLRRYLESQDPEDASVQACIDKITVNVSYIWIGESPSKTIEPDSKAAVGHRARGILGQDILAPGLMSNRIDPRYTRLMFWCLDEFFVEYQTLFAKNKIRVSSIEKYLQDCCQKPDLAEDARKVLRVMKILLSPERNSRRDKMIIKNFVAFYLLNSDTTDYVMDTNVRPASDLELNLHKYNHFHVPCTYQELGVQGVDVWTMYSPPNDPVVYDAFNLYYQKWEHIEKYYEIYGDTEAYRASHGNLVVACLCMSEENINNNLWMAEYLLADRSLVCVKELGIRKYYENTHKYVDRSEYESVDHLLRQMFRDALETGIQSQGFFSTKIKDTIYDYVADEETKNIYKTSPEFPKLGEHYTPMFRAAMHGNIERMLELIALGDNVNQLLTRTDDKEGYTPLHAAIENKQLAAIEVLLKNKALVDIPLKEGSKVYTAYDYIAHVIPENERKPYYDLFEKYPPPNPLRIKIG